MFKNKFGITIIALVVSIIVLIILAGVTLNILLGENGLINKTKTAKDENEKAVASETITLKITQCQMKAYLESGKLPDLQYIADKFCEDNDIAYVNLKKQEIGAINDKISVGESTSIFTKLENYPYEFEINSSLQLASIDGVKVATAPKSGTSLTEEDIAIIANEKIAESKHLIELNYDTRKEYTTTAENQQIIIPFVETKKIGSKLSFKDNGVLIGSEVSTVKVTYTFNIETNNSTCGYFRSRIYINNEDNTNSDSVNSVQYLMNLSKTNIVNVKEGDLITGKIIARHAGKFFICNNTMVVEVVE